MDHSPALLSNDASGDLRDKLVQLLNRQLADTVDLRSQARQARFNVKGSFVQELSSLFDGLAQDLRQFADLIAQHINALGGNAVATVRFVAQESRLRDYPLDALDGHEHVEALLSSYARYELETCHNRKAAQELGDSGTAGLFQVILASVENNLWLLEAYLEGMAVGLHGGKLPPWTSVVEGRQGNSRRNEMSGSSGAA